MRPEDFEERIRQRPFVPFRVHMPNGRTHDVRHPEMAIVSEEIVALGTAEEEGQRPKITLLSLININEFEPLTSSLTTDK